MYLIFMLYLYTYICIESKQSLHGFEYPMFPDLDMRITIKSIHLLYLFVCKYFKMHATSACMEHIFVICSFELIPAEIIVFLTFSLMRNHKRKVLIIVIIESIGKHFLNIFGKLVEYVHCKQVSDSSDY